MKSNLPGITKVGTLPARSLQPDIMLQAMAGIKVEIFKAPQWLKAVKRAKIQTEEDESEGERLQSAKLTFFSTEHIDAEEPQAFFALTADGRTLLIGTAEPPYPVNQIDTLDRDTGL